MDLLQELDDYMKESIEHALGLPVSAQTLQLKLQASEEAQRGLREQYIQLLSKLNEKDEKMERARAESSMNAQALKKFVDENQKFAAESANLLRECKRWKSECSLYERDREALMEFGNEADERAKEAEIRVQELEEKLGSLAEELQLYKNEYERRGLVDASAERSDIELTLLESVLSTFINKKQVASGHAFLEGNSEHGSCQKLLKMWNRGRLRPSTQKVISLVAEVNKTLEKDKEHLRINLSRAEEEAKLLFEENNILDEENKTLLRQHYREQNVHGSGGKHSCSASAKKNKRKSSPKMSSPVENQIDFDDMDSTDIPGHRCNSPEFRMHKK